VNHSCYFDPFQKRQIFYIPAHSYLKRKKERKKERKKKYHISGQLPTRDVRQSCDQQLFVNFFFISQNILLAN